MKSLIKLFLILITLTVVVFSWITHQLGVPHIQLLIAVLVAISLATFFILNIFDRRDEQRKRAAQASKTKAKTARKQDKVKRSDTVFALKDRKSGLTWGGGNIKASEATRGTRRKFLGR